MVTKSTFSPRTHMRPPPAACLRRYAYRTLVQCHAPSCRRAADYGVADGDGLVDVSDPSGLCSGSGFRGNRRTGSGGFSLSFAGYEQRGAGQRFEELRTKLPNNADIPEALGMITRQQGRWNASRAYTDQAISLSPQDRLLRDEAGTVRQATRDFPAALRTFEAALSIWPDEPALIDGKAQVYQALGELDQADALLAKLRPTAEHPHGVETICYQATLRRRFDGAISLLEICLDQASSLPPLVRTAYRQHLGDLQRLSGNAAAANLYYSRVRDEYEQALKEQPANADWNLSQLAYAYAGLGDLQHALTLADRAISLTPDGPLLEETRARIAARFGQSDLAIPILEHLLKTSYSGTPPLTPALLRLDPDFDPLRGNPRFQKLCEEKH